MINTTRKQVLKNIEQCEKLGKFSEHTDPIDWDNCLPVDKNFKYLKLGFKENFKPFFQNMFIVKPFTKKIAKQEFSIKIIGKENLKNIKNAITTCNHINKFDCLVIKYAFKNHKHKITAGDFNNQKGWFGEMMRVGGLMPFSSNFSAMANFNKAIEYYLTHNYLVQFYPEGSMWWNYKKPRPFKDGAFHYAVKHNVPIIPMFITMTQSNKIGEEGFFKQNYILNILPPLYANKNLEKKEQIQDLKIRNFNSWKKIYEDFYKIPLKYTCDKE